MAVLAALDGAPPRALSVPLLACHSSCPPRSYSSGRFSRFSHTILLLPATSRVGQGCNVQ